jgi:hypothetical protein
VSCIPLILEIFQTSFTQAIGLPRGAISLNAVCIRLTQQRSEVTLGVYIRLQGPRDSLSKTKLPCHRR